MVGDSGKDKKGFSGLSDLASDISGVDDIVDCDPISPPPNPPQTEPTLRPKTSLPTPKPTTQPPQTTSTTSNEERKAHADNPFEKVISAVRATNNEKETKAHAAPKQVEKVGGGRIRSDSRLKWTIGILAAIFIVLSLASFGGKNRKDTSSSQPPPSSSNLNNKLQYEKPPVGTNHAHSIDGQFGMRRPDKNQQTRRHELITEIQSILEKLGYNPGPVDGKYGRRTADALKAFQRDAGVMQDGLINQDILNSLKKAKSSDRSEVITPIPTPQRVISPSSPEQPLPYSGYVRTYTAGERIAPFEIKAAQGSHYLVKLVDAHTNNPVLTVFVRSGTTAKVDVPLGTYEVRYASGESWYGDDYLFGQDTSYSKADKTFTFEVVGSQISGFTITLYKVANGNLHTSSIKPTGF